MGTLASIEFNIEIESLDFQKLFKCFDQFGYQTKDKHGETWFLPENDSDFDWKISKNITSEKLINILNIKLLNKEYLGFRIYFDESRGVSFEINIKKKRVFILLIINRKTCENGSEVDFEWYKSKIFPTLECAGLKVFNVELVEE